MLSDADRQIINERAHNALVSGDDSTLLFRLEDAAYLLGLKRGKAERGATMTPEQIEIAARKLREICHADVDSLLFEYGKELIKGQLKTPVWEAIKYAQDKTEGL